MNLSLCESIRLRVRGVCIMHGVLCERGSAAYTNQHLIRTFIFISLATSRPHKHEHTRVHTCTCAVCCVRVCCSIFCLLESPGTDFATKSNYYFISFSFFVFSLRFRSAATLWISGGLHLRRSTCINIFSSHQTQVIYRFLWNNTYTCGSCRPSVLGRHTHTATGCKNLYKRRSRIYIYNIKSLSLLIIQGN